jgi:carbon monoxide dehydrogenase subunit G
MKLESKIGSIASGDEKIYNFLTDFDNFKKLIPEDKVQDWKSDGDTCTFTISPVGHTGIKIIEKEPHKLIKLTGIDDSKFDFYFWVQLKQMAENDTKIKLTMEVELNPMMQMMAKKPLQDFLNKLVDQLAKFDFN